MDLDDFHLAMKELKLVGARLELEDAPLPGFKRVKGVTIEGDHQLLLRIIDGDITEVVKLHKSSPRRMDPQGAKDRGWGTSRRVSAPGDAYL